MERTSLINQINDLYVNGADDTVLSAADTKIENSTETKPSERIYIQNEDELQNIDLSEFEEELETKETEDSKDNTAEEEETESKPDEKAMNEFKTVIKSNSKLDEYIEEIGYDKVFDLIDENKDGKLSEDEISKISSSAKTLSDLTAGEIKKFVKDNIDSNEENGSILEDEETKQGLIEKLKNLFGIDNEEDAQTITPAQSAPVQNTTGGGSGYTGGGSVGNSSGGSSYNAAQQAVQQAANEAQEEVDNLDKQIEELETVKIPESEENIQNLRESKDADIEEQEQKQREAIEESDEVDEELKKEYKEADEKLNETQENITEKENEKSDKESELSSTSSQISELSAQISAIKTDSDNEEKNAENQALKADLEAQKADLEDKKAKIEEEIKNIEKELKDLKEQEKEQETAKEEILKEIEESLDENSPLKKIIQETKDEIERIKETYETDNATAQETLDSQRQELEELKAERGTKAGEAENLGDLAEAFANSEFANGVLADKAGYIEEVCAEYGVDPYLVSAIMASETGYGTSSAIVNKNNPGGYMDPATGHQTVKTFSSLEEGIEAVVRNLANGYINQGLNTISSIGAKYCPVGASNDPTGLNSNWIPNVTTIYNELSGKNVDANTALC